MRRALSVLPLLVLACGPAPQPPVAPPPSKPVAPKAELPKVVSPARWVVHHSGTIAFEAKLDLGSEGTLYVSKSGERWLEKKGGSVVAADVLLPEALRGVVRDDAGRYVFLGARGTVFITQQPLGPVVEKRASKTKLRAISVGKRAFVALAGSDIVRSTDGGVSWSKVAVPKVAGVLTDLAMMSDGVGLALAAPQRALATEDDGATWTLLPTPGVGARRVVADANGELLLEGLTASAALKSGPLRLEKVARAAHAGYELAVPESSAPPLVGAEAVITGSAALFVDRRVEVYLDETEATPVWMLAESELGKPPKPRKIAEAENCERLQVAAQSGAIHLACSSPVSEDGPAKPKGKWAPKYYNSSYNRWSVRLLKSTDGGSTFKDDGLVHASDRDKKLWVSPEGLILLDGACKRTHDDWTCNDSPPVVRLPGAKSVAKAVNLTGARFDRVVFAQSGAKAFAVGTDGSGAQALYVSSNGGKDFARKALAPALDEKGSAVYAHGDASLGVDDGGTAYVLMRAGARLARWVLAPDATRAQASLVNLDVESFDLAGRRGFAIGYDGAYETVDGGATWHSVAAPDTAAASINDRGVACSAYGCLVGERAVRVGWDLPLDAPPPKEEAATTKKIVGRTPLKCVADGSWQTVGPLPTPNVGNVDLGGGTRFVLAKRDPVKATLSAVVGTTSAKGLETKEITLLGPAGTDTAGIAVMQVEGVAALRYAFKREKQGGVAAAPPPPPPIVAGKPPPTFLKKPMPPTPQVPAITPKQVVDVEVAWYVAATGKVHKATIKAAGAIDPAKDVSDAKDKPSMARTSLLSIAHGGIHVRPFASSGPDQPLYWISDAGKVEKLAWPEIPIKEVRGGSLSLRIGAARINNKSIVFGDAQSPSLGLQLFVAWPASGSAAWESRSWGLWPSLEGVHGDAHLRFVDSGEKPAIGVLFTGGAELGPTGFAVNVEAGKNDPDVVSALPTQRSLSDPPKACGKGPASSYRVPIPWSPGTRHPIAISIDGKEIPFASGSYVARMTPGSEDVCVSALDAYTIGSTSPDWYSALLPLDDLEHAALFKGNWKGGTSELSVRPMSCAFSKGPVPEGYNNTPGFVE